MEDFKHLVAAHAKLLTLKLLNYECEFSMRHFVASERDLLASSVQLAQLVSDV